MKILASLFVGLVMLLLPTKGQYDEHWVMYGPHGEVADEDTPYLLFPDDNDVPRKAYLSRPNVSYAIPHRQLKDVVRFFLWTRDSTPGDDGKQIFVDDLMSLHEARFNPHVPVKILIHGFTNTIMSPTIQNPKEAYLRRDDFNVIGVDWGDNCRFPWYWAAVDNTISVGNYVGELVKFLQKAAHVQDKDIHIIGHSLGAHVSGNAGSALGSKVGRVTGLDPAGPNFHDKPNSERLDASDAQYVDVIHTCAGDPPSLGMMETAGMADFYPNGGINMQPGCEGGLLTRWFDIESAAVTCSHSKAHELWTQSILEYDTFHAVQCNSVQDAVVQHCNRATNFVMGEDSDPSMRGIFWLKTK